MKILFDIDQQASIANGHEADDSTAIVEIPVGKLPNGLREKVANHWDPQTKVVQYNGRRPAPLEKPFLIADAIKVLSDLFLEFDPKEPQRQKSIP